MFSSLPPRDASAPLHEAAFNPLSVLFNRLTINSVYVGSRSMIEAMNRANTVNRHEPVIDRLFEFGEALAARIFGGHVDRLVRVTSDLVEDLFLNLAYVVDGCLACRYLRRFHVQSRSIFYQA